ncbi:MAG: quaternary ammonium compound-resistance protein SugE [Alteromonadaceae bacterium]|jgi:quaternary ammonium compound-resistance protein SugE|uniref:Guanidinium exporter n=2 Tax=Paraglaciecola mesophila TaxID=197222 RepID=K6XXD9_9ALTE|nr:quaternary ammonium compound efflux SMR transporter SugE [Paraglaciecola mesophila]MAD16070.1 quaternary ammonium compound-resistance protein SugE [Alteromonadaceae bacterium]GAC25274.1 quaternary ammonium compound-resistance protein SugE [Paraglaciecola mesophila KMM 241]|tara:strand:+ start:6133 stop:6447 length:315 start_codon:yes stop_codon:yes gene_type:complete
MNWIILIIAGLFEVVWAIGLKYSDGFSKLWPSIFTLVAMAISFGLLSIAMKSLPAGTAYAVWVVIGLIGTAIVGIVMLNEPLNFWRVLSLITITLGVIGLKLSS